MFTAEEIVRCFWASRQSDRQPAAANPFVDPAGCSNYIVTFEKRYNAQLKLETETR